MKVACLLLAASLAWGAEKIEILRDEFGVPHIFAATPASAAFASGYAQAQDRLEELLRNYRKAEGTMAEAFGPTWLAHDFRQRFRRKIVQIEKEEIVFKAWADIINTK